MNNILQDINKLYKYIILLTFLPNIIVVFESD